MSPFRPLPIDATQRRHLGRHGQAWLQARGSLTARLRGLGAVSVTRLRQGHQPLLAREQTWLGLRHGHVREVVLSVDGLPAVWARSVTGVTGIKGAWRAMRGLGTRPLAELLFTDRAVRRAPLQSTRLRAHGAGASKRLKDWRRCQPTPTDAPTWMRWSVFTRHGQALLVQEAFAPWVLSRPVPALPGQKLSRRR